MFGIAHPPPSLVHKSVPSALTARAFPVSVHTTISLPGTPSMFPAAMDRPGWNASVVGL
jgi:hypothetical protein